MSVTQTARHAAHRLRRSSAFATAATLTLTLGIGATTAVFSLVKAVLLRPLPYAQSDRLVDLSHTLALSRISRVDWSDATYLYYRRANRVFSDVGAYRPTFVNLGPTAAPRRDAGPERPERVAAARAIAERWRPWRSYAALHLWPGDDFAPLEQQHPTLVIGRAR